MDTGDIGRIFTAGFRAQFGQQRENQFKINWRHLLSFKDPVDLSHLEVPFSVDEIKEAVLALGADKALGPDGFPVFFFQRF